MSALEGKRIVITRAPHQSAEFDAMLHQRQAIPLSYPCIDIAPPENIEALDNALRDALQGKFDWLVLTSTNTVQMICNRLTVLGSSLKEVSNLKVAAVGSVTALYTREVLGISVSVVPDIFMAEQLVETLKPVVGRRYLLPQSSLAVDAIQRALIDCGAEVVAVEAYRTVIGSGGVDLQALLEKGEVDVITFASPSSVQNLLMRLELDSADADFFDNVVIACIGTKTASAARAHGFSVDIIANEHTVCGLTTALEQYFDSH